jgi:hypothetical protein
MIRLILAVSLFVTSSFGFDTLQVKEVGPGVIYYKIIDSIRPLSIDVLKIDLKNKQNDVEVFIPFDTLGVGGLTASQFSKYLSKKNLNVIAGVNADFFGGYPIQAQNSTISNGELIKGANLNRSLLIIDSNRIPSIDKFKFVGELLINKKIYKIDGFNNVNPVSEVVLINSRLKNYSKEFHPFQYSIVLKSDLKLNEQIDFILDENNENIQNNFLLLSKNPINQLNKTKKGSFKLYFKDNEKLSIKSMVGGLPGLYKDSKLIHDFFGIENVRSEKFIDKNPRTAVGYNSTKDTLVIVTVDGRQPNHSMGLNLYELSRLMKMLGCTDALNLDGGGSSSMVIRDSVVNKPSDLTGERILYSMLMVLSKGKSENKIEVFPKFKEIMHNHTIDFDLKIYDEWGYETKLDSTYVEIKVEGVEGKFNNYEFIPSSTGNALFMWNYKNHSDTTRAIIIPGE